VQSRIVAELLNHMNLHYYADNDEIQSRLNVTGNPYKLMSFRRPVIATKTTSSAVVYAFQRLFLNPARSSYPVFSHLKFRPASHLHSFLFMQFHCFEGVSMESGGPSSGSIGSLDYKKAGVNWKRHACKKGFNK